MWWNLILGVVMTVISWLLRPKPEPPKAGTLADFNAPKAEEGAELGWVYGTVWIKDPQVHWYGDWRTIPVKTSEGKK